MTPLALWVGPEATVNRVGDVWHDQLARSGFADRLDDLDRLAATGAQAMRFPLLWERTVSGPQQYDWRWADARLTRVQQLGIRPIVGLVHHGSGPPGTHLLDPDFPSKLAHFARAVAQRYPWVMDYTPINEPLTTARFSALYGIWYPHARSDQAFVQALLNQVMATLMAMRAIRRVQPSARLIQTDDLGHTTGTAPLQYQVDFDNARRWLGFDLLMGCVDAHHPMWPYLRHAGASAETLDALREQACPPDVIGINTYLTSERFLDHRLARYPVERHGGNGRDAYADLEAVRVLGHFDGGVAARLREASQRYGRPVALTEAHLGCTRDEQLRWLAEAWDSAEQLRSEGHPVVAVTAWSAMGAFDWNSLLTRHDGCYEPGLWDVRTTPPRPTALFSLARQLATGQGSRHVVTQAPGWWRRRIRLHHIPHGPVNTTDTVAGPPILITGATGTLGRAFARLCEMRGLPFCLLGRQELDIADEHAVAQALLRWQPWAVINTAGYVRVDEAERDPRQWRENVTGAVTLARACAARGIRLIGFSSDLVFDGQATRPYIERDPPAPLNAYGRAKAAAECAVLASCPQALMVRTAAFFGPWDEHNFVTLGLARLRRGETWTAPDDQVVSPTYVPDLVQTVLDLLIDEAEGLWHLCNQGQASWYELARMAARHAGLDETLVHPVSTAALAWPARRPAFSAMGSERGLLLPPLEAALQQYFVHRQPAEVVDTRDVSVNFARTATDAL